ncbi:T9SS type A sorting domain-containing protein [Chryseobacterium sp.]|uniref:T9SS type A sorting domain-containing protein n=1 Tax=Chryseobacterium sp. TaxID=1871047 RepID=UPI0025BB3DB3|nr:T9SS type A sorting domain-containing protein [Chryseobacterium sp.]MBV8325954.1 T9SS type A sorting domain-containing protein [Chryseobacterium sp.]
MIGNLYFAMSRKAVGIMLMLIAFHSLYAQGISQNCNNTDPGNTPGDIGCVSFTYQGHSVSYTTVRGNDGKIWLQQNLGSSQVALSMGDDAAFGDLFQWGRWDDGHQLRNSSTASAPSVNRPDGLAGNGSFITGSPAWWAVIGTGDEWTAKSISDIGKTNGVDPCKAIGAEWKMPSQTDWAGIVNAENITVPATAYNSHLKLPAGGYRSASDGGFTFVGARGYFWSADSGSLGGKYLYVGTIMSNPSAGASRGQGASVRCIKNVSSLGTSEIRLHTGALEIYPNPTKGIVTVKADTSIESIQITNIAGQQINIPYSNNQVDLNHLSEGLYILKIKLKTGQTVSKKIIKE